MEDLSPHSPQPLSALVVDDAIANLRLLSAILMEEGITPRPLTCGRLALAAAHADPPDLVLLDIDMPEMDGFEVCAALKEDPVLRAIPVIFISGLTDTSRVVKALAMGGVDYITKPFQAEEVAARIRTHLRVLRLQQQVMLQNQSLERQVAERTHELADAMFRLQELSELKNEFFAMFAHEIRTPVNGLFGMCDMIVDLCPPSEQLSKYQKLYASSKDRLLKLIEDTTLIASLSTSQRAEGIMKPLILVLQEVALAVPEARMVIQDLDEAQQSWVEDERGLLIRSLATVWRLAHCFSPPDQPVFLSLSRGPGRLFLHIPLDRLPHSQEELDDFFRLESTVRSASYAESLGLAPVAAHRILASRGGRLALKKTGQTSGTLEIDLPLECPETRHS